MFGPVHWSSLWFSSFCALYDLIWPEGGLCELEEGSSLMRFYCGRVEESRGSYSCPSMNWLMRNSFMWKTEWVTRFGYTLTHTQRMHISARMKIHAHALTSVQVHEALYVNKQVADQTLISTHTLFRWRSELPCCVDLCKSRGIKLYRTNPVCVCVCVQMVF